MALPKTDQCLNYPSTTFAQIIIGILLFEYF
jgi:hypothetical protein